MTKTNDDCRAAFDAASARVCKISASLITETISPYAEDYPVKVPRSVMKIIQKHHDSLLRRAGELHEANMAMRQAAQANSVAVPAGWQLVPVEPTAVMLNIARQCQSAMFVTGAGLTTANFPIGAQWEAMLAAAPTAPTASRKER